MLPLPGQLKPWPIKGKKGEQVPPEQAIATANKAARIEPTRAGYINAIQVYPWTEGALYRLYTSPEKVSAIVLQPAEELIDVSTGDTVRWVIADTISGQGSTRRVHILVKPTLPDIQTNLVVLTDRRTYHLELVSTKQTYMASISWTYPTDSLVALHKQNQAAQETEQRVADRGVRLDSLNFRYRIEGDDPPWRPLRAFDDGHKVFIQMPSGISQGEAPPLFIAGADGRPNLVNYRVRGLLLHRRPDVRRGRASPRRKSPAYGSNHSHRCAPGLADLQHGSAHRDRRIPTRCHRNGWNCGRGRGLSAVSTNARSCWAARSSRCSSRARRSSRSVRLGCSNPPSEPSYTILTASRRLTGSPSCPRSYQDLPPKLGPPSPGDIGRAFAESEKKLGASPSETPFQADPEQDVERAERIRQARIAQQAKESGLLFRLSEKQDRRKQSAAAVATTEQPSAFRPAPADNAPTTADLLARAQGLNDRSSEIIPSSQARKLAFVSAKADKETTNPHALAAAPSPYAVMAGSIIPASLITGLNSDLPGSTIAQVTENVYDTVTGEHLLVPQGTRLFGKYDSVVALWAEACAGGLDAR